MKEVKKGLKTHFIGIGGISMNALAKYLISMGFEVSGSDSVKSKFTDEIEALGGEVFIGQDARNIGEAQIVVYSSAIGEDNPELKEGRKRGLFVLSRAELLQMIAENFGSVIGVSGCHGKTTTTCMIAHIFRCAGKKFTSHIGGVDLILGNFFASGSEYFLTEACEFKKNLLLLEPDTAVCLGTQFDHPDSYKDREDLKNCYFKFIGKGKKAIINGDDENLATYDGKNAVKFGLEKTNDYFPTDIREKKGRYSFVVNYGNGKSFPVKLKIYGYHNIYNALAACACALENGLSVEAVTEGLSSFIGVERRFENIGKLRGATVIADYAHHPDEIEAAFSAAEKLRAKKLFVVFQPHTYSRTLSLKDKFVTALNKIPELVIYKTYPAREEYVYGGSAYDLYIECGKKGIYFGDAEAMISYFKGKLKRGDVVLVLGAGDIYDVFKKAVR
ncbi:MAG: UDP-N-acetylmuramate--L-alanine ligase [Clostridia bacterium]|nr:UDP-N-acetylmuramate--L-alanine ligase [Clostridia bacterium]